MAFIKRKQAKVNWEETPGCIIACKNGLLVAGRLLVDAETHWHVHACDEKRSKKILKSNPRWQVFAGEDAMDAATTWQGSK